MGAAERADAAADRQRQKRQASVAAIFLRHKLVKGNGVLVRVGIHGAGGEKDIGNAVAGHVPSGGVGETGKKRNVVAVRLERFGGLVQLKAFALALGEPMPLAVVWITLFWQGDTVWEEHAGQALGGGGLLRSGRRHGLQKGLSLIHI